MGRRWEQGGVGRSKKREAGPRRSGEHRGAGSGEVQGAGRSRERGGAGSGEERGAGRSGEQGGAGRGKLGGARSGEG